MAQSKTGKGYQNIELLLGQILPCLTSTLNTRKISLEKKVSPELGLAIDHDGKLKTVLLCSLLTAIDHCKEGSVIYLQGEENSTEIKITIKISPDQERERPVFLLKNYLDRLGVPNNFIAEELEYKYILKLQKDK